MSPVLNASTRTPREFVERLSGEARLQTVERSGSTNAASAGTQKQAVSAERTTARRHAMAYGRRKRRECSGPMGKAQPIAPGWIF